MIRRARWALVAVGLLLVLGGALAAANTVSSSLAGSTAAAGPTANDLKPPECAALNLAIVSRPGGGNANLAQLILGTAGNDNINGGNRDDCIVGGAGNDRLSGGAGNDVCIGGPGDDNLHASCEHRYP
jgi:Ca2+-binding RTX toxin-like protein